MFGDTRGAWYALFRYTPFFSFYSDLKYLIKQCVLQDLKNHFQATNYFIDHFRRTIPRTLFHIE